MSNSSKKVVLEQVNELLHQAEEEERKYEWYNVIELLKKAEKICLDNKLKEIEAEVYYKLGEIYYTNTNYENRKEKILDYFQLSISSFQKALDGYKGLKNEEKINATLGFINFLEYISGSEKGREEVLLESARKYFNKAKKQFFKSKNSIESLKIEILEGLALFSIIINKAFRIDEYTDFKELVLENVNLIEKIWEEIKKQQDFPELYLLILLYNITIQASVFAIIPCDNFEIKPFEINILRLLGEIIEKLENSKKISCLFSAYIAISLFNARFTTFHTNNIFELRKYSKITQKWIQKSEKLPQKIATNYFLTSYYFIRFYIAIHLLTIGFTTKDFKHVLEYYNLCIDFSFRLFPRIAAAYYVSFAARNFLQISLNPSVSHFQRVNSARKILNTIKLTSKEFPELKDPSNKILNYKENYLLCTTHAILADLIKDKRERARHLQISFEIFNNLSNYKNHFIEKTNIYTEYLTLVSRTGLLLAKNSSKKSKKVDYYQKSIDLLLKSKNRIFSMFTPFHLFSIGSTYHKIGKLTNDTKIFKKSYSAYLDAIEDCKNKGYHNLTGLGYVRLAQIEDRLGNFLSAAENYKKAINPFDQALLTLTYTRLGKKIEKLKNYMKAWNLIEIAKSYHIKEDHYNAQLNNEQASQILSTLREYRYEAPFYSAWAILEKAEDLSKRNKHKESAATYIDSRNKFAEAIGTFNSYLSKITISETDKDRISKLIKVAKIRERYCDARYQIETARLESKKGNHLNAAELYNKSSSLFENLCHTYIIEREKDELTAVFFLCKAWESMERAVEKQKASLYGTASQLFEKASNIFPESRMQKLSLGNSLYCSALQCGSLFDKTTELEDKIKFYKKIKMHLRDSSRNYQMGGFEQDAQWALATATFFDGMWNLIQADNEIDGSKKGQFLNIATNYFESASTIFAQAGYEQKKDEITNYLKMIKNEQEILTSALNVIEKPAISASSVGIVAPSCPLEISSQVSLREMQQYDLQTESELNWYKRIHHIYFYTADGGCIYDQSFKAEEEVSANLVAGG
ncbi:MAG: hypothetical protein ACFFDN_31200, partial [Candidatus Hodarchaeota archaeon]